MITRIRRRAISRIGMFNLSGSLPTAALLSIALSMLAAQYGVHDSAEWVSHSPSHTARTEGIGILHDGKIYALAGFARDVIATDISEVYDPATDAWSLLAPIPRLVTHTGAAVVDEQIWVVGGFEGNHPGPAVDLVQIYDLASDSWHLGPPLPTARAAGTVALIGRNLHYVGGLLPDRQTDIGEHLVLDVDHRELGWKTAAPLPDPRCHLSSTVFEGKLYVIGGQFGHDVKYTLTPLVHVYDPVTDVWSRLADLPLQRSHAESSTFVHNGRIIIAGGVGPGPARKASLDLITAYDPVTDTWAEIGSLPEKLLGLEAGVIGDRLFAANGSIGLTGNAQTSTWSVPLESARPDAIGFSPSGFERRVREGHSELLDVLLWTHTNVVDFTIDETGLPEWISVVEGLSGTALRTGVELKLIVDASGLESGTYEGQMTAAADGYDPVSLHIALTVDEASSESYLEESGLVVIESEGFHVKRAAPSHEWSTQLDYGSVGAAMLAGPVIGTNLEQGYELNAPHLGYRVHFASTGTYYVWARSWGPDGNRDSWHVGLDGFPVSTAGQMTALVRNEWPPVWSWSNSRMDLSRATIDIASCGDYVVDVWMREDGVLIDRMLLTTDAEFTPELQGPGESPRVELGTLCDTTSTSGGSPPEVPYDISLGSNYPNPFRSTTQLQFSLSQPGPVTLTVFNLLGERIAVVLNESMPAGTHDVAFDAHGLAGGIYVYELRAGTIRRARHMVLLP